MRQDRRRVLILGAYGLIGARIARHLSAAGYQVTGLGRNRTTAQRILPDLAWHIADLRDLTAPSDWADLLKDCDAVVNCAGALQDGGEDDLSAVHHRMLAALSEAAARHDVAIVQISAAGVCPDASTAFFRSKAAGDAALLASAAPVWILRPGLVIAQQAYGGTMLLRMLAAVPFVQPVALGKTPVQSVGIDDLARAVEAALAGELPEGEVFDLVEDTPRPLREVIAAHRNWLGFPPARMLLPVPAILLPLVGRCADGLGRLGWRSPLRSTALEVLKDGITGDPAAFQAAGGAVASLPAVLASIPVGAEHRMQARLSLLMPVLLVGLSLFWIVSGVMGVVSLTAAAQVLTHAGWALWPAKLSVLFWAVVDVALGMALWLRRWAGLACWGMIFVSVIYLCSASFVTPQLWVDPLGPLVKVIPVILAALTLRVMLERR
ncbi:hypothetical protein XMM379_001053 [Aliiroseovarius sp. xm-m-379]|uniref:SDR family oxidoreductase n=1 Tax=unclassified Aliiroseovarius TaxID=2623558 RepID=UPI001568A2DE|nr:MULTISPECIES: SDR family oxidoreductase [unclassified Aliiroseovarius]NRP24372.1 hypothetical protein [Aliiroseovarius sp. xm-m-379]NRP33171.1 hypothetical protein [Aliiroseovarius sp. xm-a-104]NRQ20291.1 hypothetical protein [Aliiroseovarius sp. xm-v-204]